MFLGRNLAVVCELPFLVFGFFFLARREKRKRYLIFFHLARSVRRPETETFFVLSLGRLLLLLRTLIAFLVSAAAFPGVAIDDFGCDNRRG